MRMPDQSVKTTDRDLARASRFICTCRCRARYRPPEFGIKDRLPDAARDLVMNTPHADLLMTTRLVTAPCHVDARLK